MSNPKLRRVAAALVLASLASLTPVSASAGAARGWNREGRAGAERTLARRSWLETFVVHMIEKLGVRIDPDGNK